jgi:hypothetical protein
MSTRVNVSSTTIYLIAVVVIIAAFLLLGGGTWLRELFHGGRSINMARINWVQVLISSAIGFVLGLLAGRRKW